MDEGFIRAFTDAQAGFVAVVSGAPYPNLRSFAIKDFDYIIFFIF